ENNRLLADQQRNLAEERRVLADQRTREIQRNLYVADMNQAWIAVQTDAAVGHASDFLDKWRYTEPDLRGWEWYYLNALYRRDLRIHANRSLNPPRKPPCRRQNPHPHPQLEF